METQVDKLHLQVEMLEKQLKKAEETEQFLKDQIKEKIQASIFYRLYFQHQNQKIQVLNKRMPLKK